MNKEIKFIIIENSSRNRKTGSSTIVDNDQEKWYIVASQVFLPFMIAGFGMVAAGLVLERVKVFKEILISEVLVISVKENEYKSIY